MNGKCWTANASLVTFRVLNVRVWKVLPTTRKGMNVLFLNRPPSPLQPWYDDFVAALGGRFPVELYDPARPLADQFRGVGVVIDHGGFGADRTFLDAASQAGVKLWQALSNGVDYVDRDY